jgi:trk system potassium uptake protein TrkA
MAKKQYCVIGLGTFGYNVALELSKKGAQVLAIDNNESTINKISADVAQALILDATDDGALKKAGVADCDAVIISIGESIETSILATLIVKDLGVKNIIVKCTSAWHSRIAVKIGATQIIFPELEMAQKLVSSLISPNIIDQITLSKDYNIMEFIAPKQFFNKTIASLDIRKNYGVIIIAVTRRQPVINSDGQSDIKDEITIAPGPDVEILENDVLIVIGTYENIDKIKKA